MKEGTLEACGPRKSRVSYPQPSTLNLQASTFNLQLAAGNLQGATNHDHLRFLGKISTGTSG